MNFARQIISFGAILYASVCLVNALFFPSSWNLTLDNYLFPFAFIHMLWVLFENKGLRIFFLGFFLIFGWGIISDVANNHALAKDHLMGMLILLKWPVIIASFINNEITIKWHSQSSKWIDGLFLLLAGVNIFIILNPSGFGEDLQVFFSSKEYVQFVYFNESGSFRLSGTAANPNDNAAIFGAFVLYYLHFRDKEKWMYVALAVLLIFFTQSRTALIAVVLASIFLKRHHFREILSRSKRIYYLIILLLIPLLTGIVLMSRNVTSLFTGEAFISSSFLTRISNFRHFSESSDLSQLIGYGKINDPFQRFNFYFDSEYVAMLFQFGWIGLLLLLLLYLNNLFLVKGYTIRFRQSMFIYVLLISFTNLTFLNDRFGTVLVTLLAYAFLSDLIYERQIPTKSPSVNP